MTAQLLKLLRTTRILPFFVSIAVGGLGMWFAINLSNGAALVVLKQAEADGPQFSDPNQLDIVTKFHRNRVCPSVTQRFVWRWTKYGNDEAQQIIPLQGTALPFFADSQTTILTIPNPGVPDINDHWFFRSVTQEQCAWVPNFVSEWLGTHLFRSADVPVNFVGDPHEIAPK